MLYLLSPLVLPLLFTAVLWGLTIEGRQKSDMV
jgi:hypothetical protein